jgi:hypothetical protein
MAGLRSDVIVFFSGHGANKNWGGGPQLNGGDEG